MKFNLTTKLRAWSRGLLGETATHADPQRFGPPTLPAGVIPDGVPDIAMDSGAYEYANQSFGCHESFPGYPVLAQLTQIAEYRMLTEKTAQAMVRKWIKVKSRGDDDKTDKINKIEAALTRLRVRETFQEAAIHDGFFGRAQVFIDLGEQDGPGLEIALFKDANIVTGKLRKLKLVEAMFTYPNVYSASNPMADDYYNPSSWFVMGQKVHATRLLTFVGRPVPDILKPAYNFGGLSMSQIARPYVENWVKTRDSVNRLISNYSTSGLKTDLSSILTGDAGDELLARAEFYTQVKDNQGMMLVDNATEEFFQFNVPLSTIDKLQAQAQEHMAAVSSMPLPILTGVTPAGLNASAEGDIRIFYDHILDQQERLFRPNLTTVIELIQLSEIGDIDPDIVFEFVPLWNPNEKEAADTRKADAETAQLYFDMGVLQAEEVRAKLASDEHSGYNGLDLGIKIDDIEGDAE